MNDSGSVVEFFYNVIPGTLFVFFLNLSGVDLLDKFNINEEKEVLMIFVYIILGIFFGFVFQGLTKLAREIFGLNKWISRRVRNNNPEVFKETNKKLIKYYKNGEKIEIDVQKFYLMDNYLRGKSPAFLPTHFSSRFAFWSNIFFAALILMLTNPYQIYNHLWLIVLIFSGILSYKYFYAFYDTILKTYFMEEKNKENQK